VARGKDAAGVEYAGRGASGEGRRLSRNLVLVVSIGRSGTSLFAGILAQLGFRVPQPEVEANRTNPRGFSEPRWVVDFHRPLMRERRVRLWDSRPTAWELTADAAEDKRAVEELKSWLAVQFVGTENIVIKDPRTAWFLPLWQRCAAELEVETALAIVARYPAEVVASARRWYGTRQSDASRTAALLNVMLHAEAGTRAARRTVTRYDKLLEDWPGEMRRIGEILGLPSLAGVEPSAHPQIEAFVDPSLRRSSTSWERLAVPADIRTLAEEVWTHVSRLSEPSGDDEATWAALDAARAAYVELYKQTEAIAFSSLTAAAPPRRAGPARRRRERFRARAIRGLRRRAAGVVPERHRDRVRLTLSGLSLGAGGLAGLPLRAALLVPTRYRERVPVPVVRAVMRFVRWLRN
jgi:hypothetical protein